MEPQQQQQQQQKQQSRDSNNNNNPNAVSGPYLYDLFLDLPHPCASSSCPPPFMIESPVTTSSTGGDIASELRKNLLQIVRFAFPEYDETNIEQQQQQQPAPTNPGEPPALNKYDVYAMQSKSFQSFTFSLQLGTGVRVHGHVRRYLPPHLVARTRYDVGRRGERALCILTRMSGADLLYSSILKTIEAISSQQAALSSSSPSKMPHNQEPQKWFLYQLSRYQQHLTNFYATKPVSERGKPLIAAIPCIEIGDNYHNLYKEVDISRFIIPTCLLHQPTQHEQTWSSSHTGGSILPLLRCVGVAHALRIMTALLSERRVILVSSSPTRLATCSTAAVSMLSCGLLHWQHLYIPVLPPHLWQYLAAPYPYLIGILSTALSKLAHTDGLGEVLIIHLDTNQMETRGIDVDQIPQRLPDLFRMASQTAIQGEQFVQQQLTGVAAVSATEMLGQDLFEVLKMDKKILYGVTATNMAVTAAAETAAKTATAVKNAFFKFRDKSRQYLASQRSTSFEGGTIESSNEMGPGDSQDDVGSTTSETPVPENTIASDYIYTEGCHNETSEEEARIAFTAFFLCLVGDMRWYLSTPSGGGVPVLDRKKFLQQKRAMGEGEGTAIFPLLTSFCQTQMLEEFAKARIEEVRTRQQLMTPDAPLFLQCTSYHRQHHIDFGILNVKRIVRQIADNNPSGSRLTGMLQTNARRTAMTLTSNKGLDGGGDTSKVIAQLVDQCRESTSILFDVMSVIWLRLRDCRGMNWKHGLQALNILRNLLYHGPLAAIAEAVDGLDKIRALTYYENMRPVSVFQIRAAALGVYTLLVDRAKLFHIRRVCMERRRQIQFPTNIQLQRERNARFGVPFRNMHGIFHPSAARGTVVQIPPKAPTAQTMVRDTPPPQQQQQQQQEVDFFGTTETQQQPPGASSSVPTDDLLNLFDTFAVSNSTSISPSSATSGNPFDAFVAPPQQQQQPQRPPSIPTPSVPSAATVPPASQVLLNNVGALPNFTQQSPPAPQVLANNVGAPPNFTHQNPSNQQVQQRTGYPSLQQPAQQVYQQPQQYPIHPQQQHVLQAQQHAQYAQPPAVATQVSQTYNPQQQQKELLPPRQQQPTLMMPQQQPPPHHQQQQQTTTVMPPQQQQQRPYPAQPHPQASYPQQYPGPAGGGGYGMPQQQMLPPGSNAGYPQHPHPSTQQQQPRPASQFDPFAKR